MDDIINNIISTNRLDIYRKLGFLTNNLLKTQFAKFSVKSPRKGTELKYVTFSGVTGNKSGGDKFLIK